MKKIDLENLTLNDLVVFVNFLVMLTTSRLKLRPWRESDFPLFAALNADPEVRKYFPGILSEEESNKQGQYFSKMIDDNGWGFWTAELLDSKEYIGFIGLAPVSKEAPFGPTVEIGWRLAKSYWGKGFATEGAIAARDYAFIELKLPEIVAFTAVNNAPSRKVMTRIGMQYSKNEDFDHPKIEEGNPLRRHVLYRITKEEWQHVRR